MNRHFNSVRSKCGWNRKRETGMQNIPSPTVFLVLVSLISGFPARWRAPCLSRECFTTGRARGRALDESESFNEWWNALCCLCLAPYSWPFWPNVSLSTLLSLNGIFSQLYAVGALCMTHYAASEVELFIGYGSHIYSKAGRTWVSEGIVFPSFAGDPVTP